MFGEKRARGFSIVELLIVVGILGVIAAFTLPGLLSNQGSNIQERNRKVVQEAAQQITAAYTQYRLNNNSTTSTGWADIMPYLNYVKNDTSTNLDLNHGGTTRACNNSWGPCVLLHNGAMVQFYTNDRFTQLTDNYALTMLIDPDGKVTDASTTGPGKSVWMFMYYDGAFKSAGQLRDNSCADSAGGCGIYAMSGQDPIYWSW